MKKLLELSLTSTGKETFYNSSDEQIQALIREHSTALVAHRQRYAAMSLMPINDQAKTMIVRGLLASGGSRPSDADELEWMLIKDILQTIPISRTLRFYVEFVARKNEAFGIKPLSNSRARRLGQWLWETATPFRVIKYAKKYKKILEHCHIPEASFPVRQELRESFSVRRELHRWLFGNILSSDHVVACHELKDRLRASEGVEDCLYKLSFDVAMGIAVSRYSMSSEQFSKLYSEKAEVASTREKVRADSSAGNQQRDVNLQKLSLLELIRWARDHQAEWENVLPLIKAKASQLELNLPDKTAIVIDNSLSMIGSGDRKGYPIAFAEALMRICIGSGTPSLVLLTRPADIEKPLMASGETDIRLPVAKAINAGSKHIIIVSDGYENRGSVNAIASMPVVKAAGIKFYHINPVSSAEAAGVRRFGQAVEPIALSGLEQLPAAVLLNSIKENPQALDVHLDSIYGLLKQGRLADAKRVATLKDQPLQLIGCHEGGIANAA